MTGERINNNVRYWAFFLLKLGIVAALSGGLLFVVNLFWGAHTPFFHLAPYLFGFDLLYTTVIGLVFLASYGMLYLAVLDQRFRCRTCLRRLRMPVETGSWSRMLQFGRPRIEYICTYGHGKLNVEEIQFTGTENPKWKQHEDMWRELCGTAPNPDRNR